MESFTERLWLSVLIRAVHTVAVRLSDSTSCTVLVIDVTESVSVCKHCVPCEYACKTKYESYLAGVCRIRWNAAGSAASWTCSV